MGTFDAFSDTPFQIKTEGREITLVFDRINTTTGTVSWNIPPPAAGCTAETQAYNGIVITLDTVPATQQKAPVNGSVYEGDPTADRDLHAGSRIGTALVVGAFYNDKTTTSIELSGLEKDVPYYIAGYAVDAVNRYHTEGVHSYSLNYGTSTTPDTQAFQIINLNDGDGVNGSDGTGLSLGTDYTCTLSICSGDDPACATASNCTNYSITFNGDNAQTYDQLVEALNDAIEQLTPAPTGPDSPGTGTYYVDLANQKLFQWDGSQNVEKDALFESHDPSARAFCDYWYEEDTEVMWHWNGASWVTVDAIRYPKDPNASCDFECGEYWFDGTTIREWEGTTWCDLKLISQTFDPTLPVDPGCGAYWYNTDDMLLRRWDTNDKLWVETNAIYWDVDPNLLVGSPLQTTYWFDETNEQLFIRDPAGVWLPIQQGYQDVFLTGGSPVRTFELTDKALAKGVYTEILQIGTDIIGIEVNVCNDIEGQFNNVFAEIDRQLDGRATVAFRDPTPDNIVRITSSDGSAPVITAGGNLFSSLTDYDSEGVPQDGTTVTVGEEPTTTVAGQYWYDTENEKLFIRDSLNVEWIPLCFIAFPTDPTDRGSCDLWWDSNTDILYIWDVATDTWMQVTSFVQQTTDPSFPPDIDTDTVWYNPNASGSPDTKFFRWSGTEWTPIDVIVYPNEPTRDMQIYDVWFNTTTNEWFSWNGAVWISTDPIDYPGDPNALPTGVFWYDTQNPGLFVWNGTNWVTVLFTTTNPTPAVGTLWYNTTDNTLREWDGTQWALGTPIAIVLLNDCGNLEFQTTEIGVGSKIELDSECGWIEIIGGELQDPVCGVEGYDGIQSYAKVGIGTDGTADERRELIDSVREQLGYPVIEVELTKSQLDRAVTIAIEELRRRSSAAYRRGFMILNIKAYKQRYWLNNPGSAEQGYPMRPVETHPDFQIYTGYANIAQVMGVFRTTAAFMTSAHGSGIFGQVVLQHLYNMGTFDLLSFHLVSEYIEQLEHLFASRLTFSWDETSRVLWLHQVFSHDERAIMDVAVERTEQDLLSDRFTGRWIEKYAVAQSKMFLSQIRGKYATLPGAGGGVSLNASDLQAQADAEMEELISQIDNYQVNNVEEFGMNCEFIIG